VVEITDHLVYRNYPAVSCMSSRIVIEKIERVVECWSPKH